MLSDTDSSWDEYEKIILGSDSSDDEAEGDAGTPGHSATEARSVAKLEETLARHERTLAGQGKQLDEILALLRSFESLRK